MFLKVLVFVTIVPLGIVLYWGILLYLLVHFKVGLVSIFCFLLLIESFANKDVSVSKDNLWYDSRIIFLYQLIKRFKYKLKSAKFIGILALSFVISICIYLPVLAIGSYYYMHYTINFIYDLATTKHVNFLFPNLESHKYDGLRSYAFLIKTSVFWRLSLLFNLIFLKKNSYNSRNIMSIIFRIKDYYLFGLVGFSPKLVKIWYFCYICCKQLLRKKNFIDKRYRAYFRICIQNIPVVLTYVWFNTHCTRFSPKLDINYSVGIL